LPDEDEVGDRLRIGRWLPSDQPASRRVALNQLDGSPADERARTEPEPAIEASGDPGVRSRRQTALIGAIVVTVLLLPVSVIGSQWGDSAPGSTGFPGRGVHQTIHQPVPVDPPPDTTDPSGAASATPGTETPRPGSGGHPAANAGGGMPAGMGSSTGAVTHPPVVVGHRIGLETVSAPGYRVRHHNFVGGIDRIGPSSSRLDRADSSFTVRAGLANSRCVSFESVNYPGFFLRHQNFSIHLHRRDRTALYAADATFCAGTGLTGRHTSFRSVNYPDRYLVHRGYLLRIEPVDRYATTRAAMTFAVRPAL
jgi:hypothetical protein